jgi:glycosyltransferase involved in cell wall biosynthesis
LEELIGVDLSIIVCTHNRSGSLRAALNHLFSLQRDALSIEVIVVDNNSTDDTAAVLRELRSSAPMAFHCAFEAAQGISHARNTGWSLARGDLVAFTDDDIEVSPSWALQIVAAFAAHSEVDCVGGKVLPLWPRDVPRWLTRDHWTPLAILDYGDDPLIFSEDDPRCLVGANVAFRREVFPRLGGFSPVVQRVKDGIGSIEDHEFLLRMWAAGGLALYAPEIVVLAPVDPVRLQKKYHRRWRTGHGQFHALMRCTQIEHSPKGRLLGVPAHLYRQAAMDLAGWLGRVALGKWDEAFAYETRLRFFWGFFQTRRRHASRDSTAIHSEAGDEFARPGAAESHSSGRP